MKYLVTGGAGFIGSNLVDKLIDEGHTVIVLDDLSAGKIENVNRNATFYKVDISKSHLVRTGWYKVIMRGVDAIFHLAALARVQPSIEDPVKYNDVNVNGTLNMLKAAVDSGVKRFVFSSSSSVYGDVIQENLPTNERSALTPMSPYALHKLIGEQYCSLFSKLYGLETISLRYFNVYGERQPLEGAYCLVMGIFANQVLNGNPLTINGDGLQRRDFTYVGDVVRANILAANTESYNTVFNIGNGNNYSVNELADMISKSSTRIHRDPVIEPRETLSDNFKAWEILGWRPTANLKTWVKKYKKDLGI